MSVEYKVIILQKICSEMSWHGSQGIFSWPVLCADLEESHESYG